MINQNKIIKDLKERNDKLSEQYRLRDFRCITLENKIDKIYEVINAVENCILKDISILKKIRNMSTEEMIMRLEATLDILRKVKK